MKQHWSELRRSSFRYTIAMYIKEGADAGIEMGQ